MPASYYKQHWIDIEPERFAAYDQILNWHPAMEPLIAPLELRPGLKVLDAGSGPGFTTIELGRRVGAQGSVTGVDINDEFVQRASDLARRENLHETVKFVASPFPRLPFDDGTFDRVWCKNVLEYVDSAADTVADFARVLRKFGIAVAVDSDWEMLALETGTGAAERDLNERVLRAARKVALR